MNLKTKLSALLFCIFSLQAISQNNFNTTMSSELHEKYWFYRERLKYFIIPGEEPGKSVVFGSRNHWESADITIADQTIKLGWYISVLATEYQRLGSQSLETDQTLTELYYAIKAFERLDLCEAYDPWFKDESKKDGFFMRSDVQLMNGEVEIDFDQFNFGMTEEDDYKSRPPGLPAYIKKIWYTMTGEITLQDKKLDAMSQDQVSHMLFGLAMVVKCFPNETITFTNTVTGEENFGYNFMINAAGNAADIGDYVGNVNLENGPLSFSLFEMADAEREFWEDLWGLLSNHPLPVADVTSHWTIFDPNEELVPRGSWAYINRWGFSEAIRKISGHQVPTSFANDITIGDGSQMWWAYSVFAPTNNHYNRVFTSILASIGNSWEFPLTHTDGRIYDLLRYEGNQNLYLLAYILFHGPSAEANTPYINDGTGQYKGIENSESNIHQKLLSAPWCGPYHFWEEGGGDYMHFDFCDCDLPRIAGDGWGSSNRFTHNLSEQYGYDPVHASRGNHTGLDYMLFYNLFHYYLNWWYGWDYRYIPYRNMINSVSEQDYPYAENGSNNGTTTNPANLRAFNSFTYNGELKVEDNENGSLNLVAGKSIRLTSGFCVKQGAHFSAKIEEYDCWEAGQGKSSFVDNNYVEAKWEDLPNNTRKLTNNFTENNTTVASVQQHIIKIYPNPAKNQITIDLNTSHPTDLYIYDIYGDMVIMQPSFRGGIINISSLNNGVYVCKMFINGVQEQQKFVVL